MYKPIYTYTSIINNNNLPYGSNIAIIIDVENYGTLENSST